MTIKHRRLSHAIMFLRPGSRPLIDFVCVDSGKGPELVEGSMVNPPSQAEIDALTEAQLDQGQASKRPSVKQRLLSLGISVADLKQELGVAIARA